VLLIGLTGGIGSGKSTVSALLASKGAVVVDADAIVHELQLPGTPVFAAIVERFGAGVVAADGSLDRAAVADIVFNDPEALAGLNGIVHPAVGGEIAQRLSDLAATDAVVVLDVPLLVESKRAYPVAGLLVVDVDPEVAVARLDERLARADRLIDNHGSRADLERQVDEAWDWIATLAPVADPAPNP
jgi:dephospho-CoA kinase